MYFLNLGVAASYRLRWVWLAWARRSWTDRWWRRRARTRLPKARKTLAKRSSQLKPTTAKFTTSMDFWVSFGHPLGLPLARVGLNLIKLKFSPNSSQLSQVFHRLATSANSRQIVLLLLLCDYAVAFRQFNGFLANWLDLAVSFGHSPMQVLIL